MCLLRLFFLRLMQCGGIRPFFVVNEFAGCALQVSSSAVWSAASPQQANARKFATAPENRLILDVTRPLAATGRRQWPVTLPARHRCGASRTLISASGHAPPGPTRPPETAKTGRCNARAPHQWWAWQRNRYPPPWRNLQWAAPLWDGDHLVSDKLATELAYIDPPRPSLSLPIPSPLPPRRHLSPSGAGTGTPVTRIRSLTSAVARFLPLDPLIFFFLALDHHRMRHDETICPSITPRPPPTQIRSARP